MNFKLFNEDTCVKEFIVSEALLFKFGWSCTYDNKSCYYYQVEGTDNSSIQTLYQISKQIKVHTVNKIMLCKDDDTVVEFKFDADKYQLIIGSKYSSVSFFKEDI